MSQDVKTAGPAGPAVVTSGLHRMPRPARRRVVRHGYAPGPNGL